MWFLELHVPLYPQFIPTVESVENFIHYSQVYILTECFFVVLIDKCLTCTTGS